MNTCMQISGQIISHKQTSHPSLTTSSLHQQATTNNSHTACHLESQCAVPSPPLSLSPSLSLSLSLLLSYPGLSLPSLSLFSCTLVHLLLCVLVLLNFPHAYCFSVFFTLHPSPFSLSLCLLVKTQASF